jgi:hypothetical protein
MNFYDALAKNAKPVEIAPTSTSYFSQPSAGLDPRLFVDNKLIGSVRNSVLGILFEHLKNHYYNPQGYIYVWIAGSGVSYQWAAQRLPGDLDCLIGVDYLKFRQANTQYRGLSDQEIADMFNEDFRNELWPQTSNYLGAFELTFYVNAQTDISKIKPYAAYSLTDDNWTVEPQEVTVSITKDWEHKVTRDKNRGVEILTRYSDALEKIGGAKNEAMRINAESTLKLAVDQASALFEEIHHGRKSAFSQSGMGYIDYANYRWQAGKASGLITALRALKELSDKTKKEFEEQTYGMELPSAKTLVRRASLYKN